MDSELEPRDVRCHHQVWNSARYVQTQCMMCTTQSSKSTSSLVYLLLVGRVVPVVCDDAVVRRTLILIPLYRSLCFRRSHFTLDFAVLENRVYTPRR